MTKLSTYTLELLRTNAEFVVSRGQRETEPRHVFVVAPLAKEPAPGTLRRLEDEYEFRTKLDPAWAALPLDLVRDNQQTVLVLADPGGEPLTKILEKGLELAQLLRIAIGVVAALSRLHERALIHKDIKPANILADLQRGRVWLTGFGTASNLPRERQVPGPLETIAGTLAYMAPEQTGRMNRSIDSRSDLYSLGVTLYEVLTGVLPFPTLDAMELVHGHIARQPPAPSEKLRGLPAAIDAVVLKLLAKNPEDRYRTAARLELDLRACLEAWLRDGRIEELALGDHDVSDRLVLPEKLYGREAEIDQLR